MNNDLKKAIYYAADMHHVYVGRLEKKLKRFNVPPTLLVSLEDEFEVFDHQGRLLTYSKSLLIPAGTEVNIDTHGATVAELFLSHKAEEFEYFQTACAEVHSFSERERLYTGLNFVEEIARDAVYLNKHRPVMDDAITAVSEWKGEDASRPDLDSRIKEAMRIINSNLNQNLSIDDIAKPLNISSKHLIDLFKRNTGSPIRRYRLWQRLIKAAECLGKGESLTNAALSAGFTDYAHYAKTFRQLNGGKASEAIANTWVVTPYS